MTISIKNLEKDLKEAFKNSTVQSIDSVYEKSDNGYRLVIDIKNLFGKKTNVIYTKFIFYTDGDKIYLSENQSGRHTFRYLYDINCNYVIKEFDNEDELKNIIVNIIENNKFGENIKILSNFIKSPGFLINDWFSKNGINNVSVFNVKLDNRYKILPCKSLLFNFDISLNEQMNIDLIIQKERDSDYIYKFRIYDDVITEERQNLSTLIETIGTVIKTKYV